jgi:hypothetical protein
MAVAVLARRGQFATTESAFQQTPLRGESERFDRGHAYVAVWKAPETNYEICNPLDFREPPVSIRRARLSRSREEIEVMLDQDSDRGQAFGLPLAKWFPCYRLFDARTAALLDGPGEGPRSSCRFVTEREIRVRLGAASAAEPGDYVQFRGGRVFQARGRSASSTAAAEIEPPFGDAVALAQIRCPRRVSYCDDAVLDGRQSLAGLGGDRSSLTYRWTLHPTQRASGESGARLARFLEERGANQPVVRVPSDLMRQGTKHRFILTVDNRPLAEQEATPNPDPGLPDIAVSYRDSASCAFVKESTVFPLLKAGNPDKTPPVSGLTYRLAVNPEFPGCAEPRPLAYRWHVTTLDRRPVAERHASVVAGDARAAAISASARSPAVFFPPGTIWGNRLYNVTAESWFVG